nr:hypothetical protein [Tanacetum cinerariifolium]
MMIVDIEESRHGPSDAMHNPSQPFEFLLKNVSHLSRRYTCYLLTSHSEIVDIEESRHGPSDAMHNPSQPFEFLLKNVSHLSRRYTCYLLTSHSEIVDIEQVAVSSSLRLLKPKVHTSSLEPRRDQIINLIRTQSMYNTLKIEILLEPTSNKLLVDFEQLLTAQKYYQSQEYYMGQGSAYGSAHGSAPVNDDDDDDADLPVKEMSPIKKPSKSFKGQGQE